MSGSGCTNFSPTCTIVQSYYAYIPSLSTNAAYAGIFGLSFGIHAVQGLIWRKAWLGFALAMSIGNIAELIGYMGRILNHNNPFDQTGFLIQICCITIAPAFLSAGIYFCLGTIVRICDPSISRIPPRFYAYIFIPCDFVSLVLQAIGGAIASIATTNNTSPDRGDNIMIAGVSFQVLTLSIFMLLSIDYALRLRRSVGANGEQLASMRGASEKFLVRAVKLNKKIGLEKWNTVQTAVVDKRGLDRKIWTKKERQLFHAFVWALAISTIAIFIRCVYRVVEMSYGWAGVVISNEKLFIGFEGACISVAVLILNVFHPGFCLKKPGIDEPEVAPDHTIEERLVGNTDHHNNSYDSIEEIKAEKRFSRRKSNLPVPLSPVKSAILTSGAGLFFEELPEEQTPRPMKRMTLSDILRESRFDFKASTASAEGWAGQNLRDSITLTRVSYSSEGFGEKKGSRGSTLRSATSSEDLIDGASAFQTVPSR